MNHVKVFLSAATTVLIAGTMSSASATGCTGAGPCDTASVNWDLTTDKSPSSNNFDVKKDGPLRSFDTVGSFLGSISQCNTGSTVAQTGYSQDPAANIKVSTTAIGNNVSFGVKTR